MLVLGFSPNVLSLTRALAGQGAARRLVRARLVALASHLTTTGRP